MANQITDGRTLVHAADVVTPYDNLAGSAAGTLDTEIKVQGTGSIGAVLGSTLDGILYDAGSAQDWSANTFYIWINCGIVGLLDTKANGGFRIRFAGATVTNWFEVYVGGSDDWPTAVAGGWVQFVVDIDRARLVAQLNGWTNGTVPATSAIRYVGWAGVTGGTMPRMVDNTWMDEIRRLPDGSAGILVEGRNGGTTPWTFADIATQLGVGTGTFVQTAGGAFKINTTLQIGINDASIHEFSDTNAIVLWDNQEFLYPEQENHVYTIKAVGGASGTTKITLGTVAGTGDDRVGTQGGVISAAATGARWNLDFRDVNIDEVNLYGCLLQHSFRHYAAGVTRHVNCLFNDFNAIVVDPVDNGGQPGTEFLKCNNVASDIEVGTAQIQGVALDDIRYCEFEAGLGHAIELSSDTGTATQESRGNKFSGFGGTPGSNLTPSSGANDAAIYNQRGEAVTINVTEGGDTPSVRNGASATTTVNNSVSIVLSNLVAGSRVYIENTTDSVVLFNQIEGTTTFSETINYNADKALLIRVRNASGGTKYKSFETTGTLTASGFSLTVNQELDQ